jgi:trigger factor
MKNEHKIEIEIKGKEWEKILDDVFQKRVKEVRIDGFRKGKCPKNVYLQRFGIESLYMDAIDEAVQGAYMKALTDNKLVPACEPKMDVKDISKDHVKFAFTIITRPEIKLGEYKKLDVKKDAVKVTKKEIDEEVARMLSRFAEIVVKENGKVVEGNTAVIDFEGYVDGKPLEGGSGSDYPLEIGSGTFIPGFEDGLVGMKVGDTKDLELKFPKEYTKELAGKDVKFTVTVKEIKERVLPELNEDFYADLGYPNIKTEEEFKKEVETALKARKEQEVNEKYVNEVLKAAANNIKVEINPEIIHAEVERMMNEFDQRLSTQGVKLDQYLQLTGSSKEDFEKQLAPEAEKRVKERYLLEEVAEKEKIEATDEDANKRAEELAGAYGVDKEEIITHYGLDNIKYDVRMSKAIKLIAGEK